MAGLVTADGKVLDPRAVRNAARIYYGAGAALAITLVVGALLLLPTFLRLGDLERRGTVVDATVVAVEREPTRGCPRGQWATVSYQADRSAAQGRFRDCRGGLEVGERLQVRADPRRAGVVVAADQSPGADRRAGLAAFAFLGLFPFLFFWLGRRAARAQGHAAASTGVPVKVLRSGTVSAGRAGLWPVVLLSHPGDPEPRRLAALALYGRTAPEAGSQLLAYAAPTDVDRLPSRLDDRAISGLRPAVAARLLDHGGDLPVPKGVKSAIALHDPIAGETWWAR